MRPMETGHMLNFNFEKSTAEIVERVKVKQAAIERKIEEREGRISKLREEYRITDAVLVDLLTQARNAQKRGEAKMSYSTSSLGNGVSTGRNAQTGLSEEVVIGAGVVNNLLTEGDFVESERAEVKKLGLVVRNLKDQRLEKFPDREVGWNLSYAELEYLGF